MTPLDLKIARLRLGFKSRRSLAEALGMSTQTVHQWERGERRIPPWMEVMLRCMRERNKWMPKGLHNYPPAL